jgi:dTDP-4-dehydrorhamnose 3,5-epimerase
MKFHATVISGAFVIEPASVRDDRGYLARTYCLAEFREHGIDFTPVQSYQSRSNRKGTVRGLHYQVPPAAEAKLVRCIAGAIHDRVVDMRIDSPTYLRTFGVDLSAENGLALFVPPMVAHGTQALTDGAELSCLSSHAYSPENERGVHFDDAVLEPNRWPMPVTEVSAKDDAWPRFQPAVGIGP